MVFRYKITSRVDSKTCPPCAREGGVSVQRTPGGLSEITFRCKIVIILNLQNNPSVGYRRQLPLHSGAKVADFSVCLFVAEIWCE